MLEPNVFKHESLQDKKSIQHMLQSIAQAIAKGELTFSDDNGEMTLQPKDLINLKVSGRKLGNEQRLDLRISWKTQENVPRKAPLKIK